eukprot:TRINITY_DN20138_c0_g1_i1.p1 TRINITY_DN20138_c0_g1~~TRINITY_DN20138_c0_g1_i1.p1  ORF type:complete len:612 (+),score=54.62 TRINITY_DN20138_c0_g1_i1:124-1959(+)
MAMGLEEPGGEEPVKPTVSKMDYAISPGTQMTHGNEVVHFKTGMSFSHGASIESLPSNVDEQLLRGVPLHEVLAGLGKHLSSIHAKESDYHLSKAVLEIDDFLSHDWGTPRLPKLIALLFLYNNKAACIVSCIVALPVSYLGARYHEAYWAQLVCPIVWALCLLFGQQLVRPFGTTRYAFLDKMCIHQTDPEKKSAGILGLAGFLRASKRLVVLWSPRYFTRLWCTYELAAWNYLHSKHDGEVKPVKFLPISAPGVHLRLLLAILFEAIMAISFWRLDLEPIQNADHWLRYYLGRVVVVFALFPLCNHLQHMAAELGRVREAVEDYDMREAECFCCLHNHRHPETGEQIACDRELVYATLWSWSRRASDPHLMVRSSYSRLGEQAAFSLGQEIAIKKFNRYVRKSLISVVRKTTNTSLCFCGYLDVVCAAVPLVWMGCDYTMYCAFRGLYGKAVRWAFEYSAVCLFVFPLTLSITIQFTRRLSSCHQRLQCGWCVTPFRVLATHLVFVVSFLILWAPGPIATDFHEWSGYPPIITDLPMLLRYLILAVVTFRVMRAGHGRGTEEQEASDDHERQVSDDSDFAATEGREMTHGISFNMKVERKYSEESLASL